MQIYKTGENRLLIALSAEELHAECVSFQNFCPNHGGTAKLLREVLTRVHRETGWNIEEEKNLRLDVLPDEKDGCFLLLTREAEKSGKRFRVLGERIQFLWKAHGLNAFLDAQRHLRQLPQESYHLYKLSHAYFGIFRLTDGITARKLKQFLCEYGTVQKLSTLKETYLEEHATRIV